MTALSKCILCSNVLGPDTKPEHIWLKSLGGRKTSRSILCDACNNALGAGPDRALAESVEFVRNLMNFPDGKRGDPPTIKGRKFGDARIALKPGGVPVLDGGKPFTITPQPDGNPKVELRVTDPEQLRRVLPDLAAALRMDEATVRKMLETADVRQVSQRIDAQHHQLSLGGPEAMRSMMKTCLLLWADRYGSQELEKPGYADAKRFVREGGDDLVGRITALVTRPLENADAISARFGKHFNLASVASNEAGQVVGYFRLYNVCAWRFVLSENGRPSGIAGIISNPADPAQWQDITTADMVSFEAISPKDDAWNPEHARQGLADMLQTYQARGSETEIDRILDGVTAKMGLSPDTPMTAEQFDQFVHEISGRIASWILAMPHEEKLSPADIARLLSDGDEKP